jgi:hypothetical protein
VSNVRFNFDQGKLEQAVKKAVEPHMRETARKMERVLADFGRKYKGESAAEIRPALQSAFRRQGWTITDPELTC